MYYGASGETRTLMAFAAGTLNQCVYQFHHRGIICIIQKKLPSNFIYIKKIKETQHLAEDEGLEPSHDGIKIRCLTNLANPLQRVFPPLQLLKL